MPFLQEDLYGASQPGTSYLQPLLPSRPERLSLPRTHISPVFVCLTFELAVSRATPDPLCLICSPVPGRQPPRGLSVAGLVAPGHEEHWLGSPALGRGQEARHGDCAAVLSRYSGARLEALRLFVQGPVRVCFSPTFTGLPCSIGSSLFGLLQQRKMRGRPRKPT